MKRVYEKPVLYVERFNLSQTIADTCGDKLEIGNPLQASKKTCAWKVGSVVIFMDSKNNCALLTQELSGVCYHAPEGGRNVFSS